MGEGDQLKKGYVKPVFNIRNRRGVGEWLGVGWGVGDTHSV